MIPIKYHAEGVGKIFSDSKIKHSWEFKIENMMHVVDCYESKISKNFEIILDNAQSLYKGNHAGHYQSFYFDFIVNNVPLQIKYDPTVDNFSLFWNGKSFKYLYNNPPITRGISNSIPFTSQNTGTSPNYPPKAFFNEQVQGNLLTGLIGIPTDRNPPPPPTNNVNYGSPFIQRTPSVTGNNGIPFRTSMIDPNLIINQQTIRLDGTCEFESKRYDFIDIDFREGDSNAQSIYTLVHNS